MHLMIQWAFFQILQTQVISYLWLAFSYKNEVIIWLKKCRDEKYCHQELRKKLPLKHKALTPHCSLWKRAVQEWQQVVNHVVFSSRHKAMADYFLIEATSLDAVCACCALLLFRLSRNTKESCFQEMNSSLLCSIILFHFCNYK